MQCPSHSVWTGFSSRGRWDILATSGAKTRDIYIYIFSVCIYICDIYIYVCMYVMYVCMYACMYACMHVCMYVMYVMYVCLSVCMSVCVQGRGWGFPGRQLKFIVFHFEKCHFSLCFTVFCALPISGICCPLFQSLFVFFKFINSYHFCFSHRNCVFFEISGFF